MVGLCSWPALWPEGVVTGLCAAARLQFDREKAPERIVHARGMTAKGHFEVTHDISHLTSAAFLNGVGTKVWLEWSPPWEADKKRSCAVC